MTGSRDVMTGRVRSLARRRRRRVLAGVSVALLVAAGVTACTGPASDPPESPAAAPDEARKSGDGQERTDLEPLTSRIPALDGVVGATWFSGTLGSDDVPGPSLYWIDAVVTLPPGAADELRATLDLAPASGRPEVVDDLATHVPAELLVGPELDEAFSDGGWRTTAYLEQSGDDVVLVIVGE